MMRSLLSKTTTTAVILSVCLFLSGCASLITNPARLLKKEPEFVRPGKVIPVWSDTILHQSGQQGQRGCGGRVMFYAGDGKRAVRVDGALMIYAWDDSKPTKERQPDRKYMFKADELQNHFSESSIGDSYSFWVPWDAAGGDRKELTLVARFVGRDGSEVTSNPAKVILPGAIPLPPQANATETSHTKVAVTDGPNTTSGIQNVSYQRPVDEADKQPAPQLTVPPTSNLQPSAFHSSEIPLTEGFLRRNMQHQPGRAFSPGDLFSDPPDNATSPSVQGLQQWNDSQAEPNQRQSDNSSSLTAPATDEVATAQPADYSLRFRDRVRNSRESRQSVGHALSERYQSTLRRAPWEKN